MRKTITFATALLVTASAFGAGEVYRWRGTDGAWHYSDQPRPGAELVRSGPMARPADEGPPPIAPPPPPVDAPAASDDPPPDTGPVVSDEVAAQVRAEAAAAKNEQCKRAEAAYQSAVQARRIYKTDAQGNRVYMNDSEIDSARLQARANRDLACGSGS